MAPEIFMSGGECEYSTKMSFDASWLKVNVHVQVDCYSFGLFIYELISLRRPYDGQESMKDCIFEGQRPLISEKVCNADLLDANLIGTESESKSRVRDCRIFYVQATCSISWSLVGMKRPHEDLHPANLSPSRRRPNLLVSAMLHCLLPTRAPTWPRWC